MSLKMTVTDRRFAPLFWTQFLGVLNDNVFKNTLVLMITFRELSVWGMDKAAIVALSGGLFILPFFLFSHIAGQFCDKLEKSGLIRFVKYFEVLIMLVAVVGFYTHQFGMLLVVLFAMGLHSAIFGPVKYSIIPELVPPAKLVEANAYVESGTFLAILAGTIAGGLLADLPEFWVSAAVLVIALLGVVSAHFVPRIPGGAPDLKVQYNPIPNFVALHRILNKNRAVYNSILAISWFWFFGAAILAILPVYCKDMLNVDSHVVTAFLAMFTIGIALGSILCEKLSFGRVELGLVPIGSLGMSVFVFALYFAEPSWSTDQVIGLRAFLASSVGPWMLAAFFLMCVFAGFFILPLYTLIQERSERGERSRVIAANNILNAVFMVVSSGLVMWFHAIKLSFQEMFAVLAIMNLLASIYIYTVVPEFTLRFWAWLASRFVYRIRARGEENIPKEGAAILVCNHVTYVDWMLIFAMIRRPVRFVMHYKFWGIPIIRTLMRQAGVIPIAGKKEDAKMLEEAFAQISAALRAGELVCIFPEGTITRDGSMAGFRPGIERALERDPVTVIPMALRGLWGTWFSFGHGLPFLKMPKHWLSRVDLVISVPIPATQAKAILLEAQVRSLLEGE
ncbi:MAG: MFS transporter [Bdellovibrionales bacterium]|nr:MFS transporter [Bdellovibrionales bacterium]